MAYISPGPRAQPSCSYAEYSAVPAATVARLPDGVSTEQGAAVMLQGLTAKSMVEVCTDVKAGGSRFKRDDLGVTVMVGFGVSFCGTSLCAAQE